MEQEISAEMVELTRQWSDIDSDEQEFLDLLQTFGEGFIDWAFHHQFPEQTS